MHATINPHLLAGALFGRDVEPRCRLIAHHDDVETRPDAMLTYQAVDSAANLGANLAGDGFPIQDTPE
jgi:hypothetical protein